MSRVTSSPRRLCLAVLVAGCGTDHSAPTPPSPVDAQGVEVRAYSYDLDLASGRMQVDLSAELPPPGGNCVTLASTVAPDDVRWDGNDATSTLTGTRLRVCSGAEARSGAATISAATTLVEARDSLTTQGFYRSTALDGATATTLLSWLGGCSRFGPCDDAVNTQVELDLVVHHLEGEVVMCPGNARRARPRRAAAWATAGAPRSTRA